jgi:ubiquinone/menaquinone biosynthesis C-methylase UbiE
VTQIYHREDTETDRFRDNMHVNTGFGRIEGVFDGIYHSWRHPYSELAQIYDHLMDHVDYRAWADYIVSVYDRFSSGVDTILEIACGTGSLSIELYKYGYSVTGTDLSPFMLKQAAEKFEKAGIPLRLFAADMVSLPVAPNQFDAVLCLYDSINYVRKPRDLRNAVNEIASVLKKGGIFIFDICTIRNSEMFFTDHTMVERYGDITCERTCRFDPRRRIQENHFVIEHPGKKRIYESHYQKIYRLEEISDILEGLPFRELGRFDDMTFSPGTEKSMRVHFVLEKL